MKKERNIITIDEYGRLNIPTDTANVWMTEAELAELFGTAAGAVNAGIKAIIKSDTLHDYEVCKYVRLENGNGADVYNMEREYILRTLGAVNKQPAISVLMACTLKRTSVADRFPTDVFDEKNK